MLDLNPLFEFSRDHCVAICAFLVPANLSTTLLTISLTGLKRPWNQIFTAAGVAGLFAGIMVLHVLTWFMIGVVMPPTYILLALGSVCLLINLWAVFGKEHMARSLRTIVRICTKVDLPALPNLHE